MAEFDLSAYLGVFLDEVDEQLQLLDIEILQLEKNPQNEETIQNIFRAAHTLKGSSASMGFEKMKEFTHHLENIFEQIRQHKLSVTAPLIDVLFSSIDTIRDLKGAIVEGTLEQMDMRAALERFIPFQAEAAEKENVESIATATFKQQYDEYQRDILLKGMTLGHIAYDIHVVLEKEALMKSVRALIVQNALKECGEIVVIHPEVEVIEDEEAFDGNMHFTLLTFQTEAEIMDVLSYITDIETIDITLLTLEMLEEKETPQLQPVVQTEEHSQTKAKIQPTVRVDVDKLEHLMNLVGELVIDQTRLVDVRGRFSNKELNYEPEFEVLNDVTNHLSRVISELQEGMMKTRMLPIEQLFNRFPRMVRDTANKALKEIDFVMEGKETELDRSLIEEISDPIIHLLRNAIDHGVETPAERTALGKPATGKVILRAAHEENHVVISITDDGGGIDPEKIKQTSIEKGLITAKEAERLNDKDAMFLIFKSGISTAKEITDISGRGVGMDIVKSHIEKLKGIIDIDSTIGEGTTFTVKLPLTLAIIRSLLVKFGSKTFAIPLVNVLEIIRLNKEEIQMVKDQEVGLIRGRVLPLIRMKEKLQIDNDQPTVEKKREFVVVVGIADKRIGIIADKTIGNQEIVIKSLGAYIGSPPFISGATIMGDGSIALILDVSTIVKEHGATAVDQAKLTNMEADDEQRLVTFTLNDEEYGIEIEKAKDIIAVPTITSVIESPDDLLGLINLRGKMVPVINLRERFNLPPRSQTKKSRIIVVENGDYDVGFLVDEVKQVLKIKQRSIEQVSDTNQYHETKLIKGVSKQQNRVVLVLAFDEILQTLNPLRQLF